MDIKQMSFDKLLQYGEGLLDTLIAFAGDLVVALLILVIGFKIAKKAAKIVEKVLTDKLDKGVVRFFYSFVNLGLKAVVIFSAVTKLGVASSSIIALLGSAGVAVGLALQGSLSNIAGGVLILILKPFQIGDYIKEDNSGNEGTVMDIDLFYTRLKTGDNQTIVIPNGIISNCSLTNVTRQEFRRVDLLIGISYNQDIKEVKEVLASIVNRQESAVISEERPVQIYVSNFGASSVDMGLRFWVPMDEYWKIRWAVLEDIKVEFDKRGIEIPFNQLEVKIHQ
ncbi:MAG: mechanosensitive ion channel [Lachnospiraceae bacterium]|nr:mechanosensitive ion channel [Lachnospiraceae bacterium]